MTMKNMKTDIIIVGCGVAGLYCALTLPSDKKITVITKSDASSSDSFLAQGGICVQRDDNDYDSFYEDTMRAGHYENRGESVDIMIRYSRDVISDLVSFGTEFDKIGNDFAYTREGAHSRPRILFHEDETGKEITSKLLAEARHRENITLIENCTMYDLIAEKNSCYGIVAKDENGGSFFEIRAPYTVLATGGIGGLFAHSTNFPHLTGDALALSLNYGIKTKDLNYIQIHPTTLYTNKTGRAFLISESVRGEGAILLNGKCERFVNELLPRDVVANAIFAEMEKEGSEHVWLSLEPIDKEHIKSHFPNIYRRCLAEGYDILKEPIPVVPAQHYFMGGIDVDSSSATSMERLYAVGETACNGVHGRNRLASNSLLESLVFAKRAALKIAEDFSEPKYPEYEAKSQEYYIEKYENIEGSYRKAVLDEIERLKSEEKSHE